MAAEPRGGGVGGFSVGGILMVLGLILMIAWSLLIGLIVTLVGVVLFAGFIHSRPV
jgi:hypothetical protein